MNSFKKYTDYKTVLTVNALIWCGGKILLLKRAQDKKVDPGLYGGIGGKVEPGESFYNALSREIKEETGLTDFKLVRPYSITQHPYPPTKAEWVNIYFYVEIAKQAKIRQTEDGEFYWIDPKNISKLPMPQDLKEYIKILQENSKAFILGFFDHDQSGKLTQKKIDVL